MVLSYKGSLCKYRLPAARETSKEAGGFGLISDYLSFRNTYWGQMQPANYRTLWKIFLEVPEVFAAVKTKTDFIVSDGWEIEAKSESHKKKVEELLRRCFFNVMLKDVVFSQQIFGDAYIELVRGGPQGAESYYLGSYQDSADQIQKKIDYLKSVPKSRTVSDYKDDNRGAWENEDYTQGPEKTTELIEREPVDGSVKEFYARDASTIRIDYNEHGEPIKYIQRVLHRRVDFYPSEMIHLPINVIGNRQYGHSNLLSLIRTCRIKYDAEEYSADFLRNGGIPRLIHQLRGFNKEQFDKYTQQLQANSQQYQRDIVVAIPSQNKDALEIKESPLSNVDMQWAEFLNYLRSQIYASLQVPAELIEGAGSSNRSMADVKMEAFDKHIRGQKHELEALLNEKFFVKDVIGFDDVTFKFKFDNVREELKRAQKMQLLSTMVMSGIVTPDEVREEYGLPPLAETDTSSFTAAAEVKNILNPPQLTGPGGEKGKGSFGGFNPAQPGVAPPQGSDDKERKGERQNVEAQRETKGSLKVKRYEPPILVEQGSITTRGSPQYLQYEHPASINADTPETRYPFGAQDTSWVTPPKEGSTPYALTREDELREVANNTIPNSFDLNHDRVMPKDRVPGKPRKPKAEDLARRSKDPERDEVDDFGDKTVAWADTYGNRGSTTSEPREKSFVLNWTK